MRKFFAASILAWGQIFGLSCKCVKISSEFFPMGPGAVTDLASSLTGEPDFQIRIHPPEEDPHDVLASLDALVKVLSSERRAEEEDFAAEKQRLLNLQKERIRDIIAAAFEPIHAMIPNPITTEVKSVLHGSGGTGEGI